MEGDLGNQIKLVLTLPLHESWWRSFNHLLQDRRMTRQDLQNKEFNKSYQVNYCSPEYLKNLPLLHNFSRLPERYWPHVSNVINVSNEINLLNLQEPQLLPDPSTCYTLAIQWKMFSL